MRFTLCLFLIVCIASLASCKQKKTATPSGDEPIEIADFIGFFPEMTPPVVMTDSLLNRKEKDSLAINPNVFAQFIPDTVLLKVFSKSDKAKVYPVARIVAKGGETYLFAKSTGGDKKAAYVFAFDKKDKYLDGFPIFRVDALPLTQQSASIDKGMNLTSSVIRKNADGNSSEGKDVYGLSQGSGKFQLIMTDALDDKLTEILNPIDTFPRKFKYATDYTNGKLNLVSIRDGRRKDLVSFFIHFEKNNGECTGELKGEAVIKSPNVVEYREGGDPCVLRMSFTNAAVTVKELEGCGARRGLRCSFDGVFPRKKEAKAPVKKKPARKQ
ncbi:MAG: hypothetical protein H7Y42_01310 [Chitinophagaceae bacterium]|nr:hypothetical protein [Chitinophagaceae bacterium]